MNLSPFDPWQELERVHRETREIWDRFLDQIQPRHADETTSVSFLPDVDLVETRDDFRLFIAAPGFVEEDFDIIIDNRYIIIRGERFCPYDEQRTRPAASEWRYGYFERAVQIPAPFNSNAVTANYEAGVLLVIIGKD